MKAREAILEALRRSLEGSKLVPLPDLHGDFLTYPSLCDPFLEAAKLAHASVVRCEGDWRECLAALPLVKASTRVLSLVEGYEGNVPRSHLNHPQRARDLDLTIAEGTLGVAESAAIWVPCQAIPERSALFLAQHLILVLSEGALVPHLHAAYARLSVDEESFGCFIAGPSKTADIEQALVIGAHGARSLTIVLRDSAP